MSAAAPAPKGIQGWHVFAALAGFFLTVATVDAILITQAVSTFSGDTADAYRKGLAYNETLAEGASQDRLGWRESRSFDPGTGRLSISLGDESGTPIDGLRAEVDIGRAATNAFDRRVELKSTGNGTYVADIPGLSEGAWTLSLTVSDNGKAVYRSRARLWKQP